MGGRDEENEQRLAHSHNAELLTPTGSMPARLERSQSRRVMVGSVGKVTCQRNFQGLLFGHSSE